MKKTALILTLSLVLLNLAASGQSVSFALKTSPNLNFVFDSIDKYNKGIVIPSFVTLKVDAVGTEWDLYMGTTTTASGLFDVNTSYGTSGNSSIPVSILQARVYNASGTSQTGTSFFNLTDIATPVYMIGSAANDASVNCASSGTNVAGSYTTQPQCYSFKVDLKATPGLTYKAGSYSLRIDFVLIQDL
ncbi:hypothetical protein ACFSJU_11210 [Paradesertivirga mongoliensis]|uniref:Uncharacterized protein n=1 Tax=Paradesertivirga mongoliensis TaxID=2100740 RepID=A0ABW4ZM95_9SPHI|nr:hypothetical protein [Pedobacter mongoliensis]